ncbi:MAG: RsmG family class I SAM-dependent methyltransferase [Candidatus Krumholzibacteria bacterium]
MPIPSHDDTDRVLSTLSDLSGRLDLATLHVYVHEILDWNPDLGLVSRRDTPTVLAGLIRQSIDFWDLVVKTCTVDTESWRVADIGSGAGFPGVVWRLLAPGLELVLVERKRRRAVFLERVVRRIGLSGIQVVEADLNELPTRDAYRNTFDLAVMLAVAPPGRVAAAVEALLVDNGCFGTLRRGPGRTVDTTLGRSLTLTAQRTTDAGTFVLYHKSL